MHEAYVAAHLFMLIQAMISTTETAEPTVTHTHHWSHWPATTRFVCQLASDRTPATAWYSTVTVTPQCHSSTAVQFTVKTALCCWHMH